VSPSTSTAPDAVPDRLDAYLDELLGLLDFT
jgi:hypothetical protein